jgi:hypothetical protein
MFDSFDTRAYTRPAVPTVNRHVLHIVVDCMLFGGVAFFVATFTYFYWDIWHLRLSNADATPIFDANLVYAVGLVGGVLGTYFAVQLGIQKADSPKDDERYGLGASLLQGRALELLGTVAFVAYFLVGAWSLVTIWFCKHQSPETIKVLASVFGGYFITLFSRAFLGNSTTTPNPSS